MILLILLKLHSYLQVLLGISLMFWSLCTLLSGFVTSYWQLAVLRFGLGLGYNFFNIRQLTVLNVLFAGRLAAHRSQPL